jgi:glycosyltransferase involved in cell wall biosynthesis
MTQHGITLKTLQGPIMSSLLTREPGLSLVLATLGRTDEVARYFESILCSCSLSIEVILVDQNEDDRLANIVKVGIASGLDIRHLRIAPRRGLSLARNEGLKVARYAIVGFPDDDCWYEQDVCYHVIRSFENDPQLDGLVARCWTVTISMSSRKR